MIILKSTGHIQLSRSHLRHPRGPQRPRPSASENITIAILVYGKIAQIRFSLADSRVKRLCGARGRRMANSKPVIASRATCQALEPRLLLAANPADPAADRIGGALSAVSAEFAAFKSSAKGGLSSPRTILYISPTIASPSKRLPTIRPL